jgi:hypothetical protein
MLYISGIYILRIAYMFQCFSKIKYLIYLNYIVIVYPVRDVFEPLEIKI